MSQIIEQDKVRGIVTLDSIVRSALMDINASMSRYEQLKHYAIEGFREFHFDMSQEIKTIQLELTAWKSAELPVDYVDFVMIGCVINNQIRVFTHDNRIPIFQEDTDGYPEDLASLETLPETSDNQSDGTLETLAFWNGGRGTAGQMYGLVTKSNGNGYYKFNRERREIQFAPSIKSDTTIYLEYISDGYSPCEKTVVNIYAAKLIRLYIHWQRIEYAKSSNMAEKMRAKDLYDKEYQKVHGRLNPITVEDVLECARDGYALGPWI